MCEWIVVLCKSGYYGQNCNNQCSINCDMIRSCDRVTGKCDRGCKPGWSGIHCDQGNIDLLSMYDFEFNIITKKKVGQGTRVIKVWNFSYVICQKLAKNIAIRYKSNNTSHLYFCKKVNVTCKCLYGLFQGVGLASMVRTADIGVASTVA